MIHIRYSTIIHLLFALPDQQEKIILCAQKNLDIKPKIYVEAMPKLYY